MADLAKTETENQLDRMSTKLGNAEVKIEQLQAELDKRKGYKIQDGENIPEWLAKIAYRVYAEKYGNSQSYERLEERGGFGKDEVLWLIRHS